MSKRVNFGNDSVLGADKNMHVGRYGPQHFQSKTEYKKAVEDSYPEGKPRPPLFSETGAKTVINSFAGKYGGKNKKRKKPPVIPAEQLAAISAIDSEAFFATSKASLDKKLREVTKKETMASQTPLPLVKKIKKLNIEDMEEEIDCVVDLSEIQASMRAAKSRRAMVREAAPPQLFTSFLAVRQEESKLDWRPWA